MARRVALAIALAAQLCVAGGVTPAATAVVVATPPTAPAPAPGPAPIPAGTVGNVKVGLLVTGLSTYTNATEQALAAGVLSVANSAAPNAPLAPTDVSLTVTSYAASISLVLQGLGLPSYPNNAAGNLCFQHSIASVTGITMTDVSVRPPGGAPGGVAVPFYVYTTSATTADKYQATLDTLGSTNSAALVAHLSTCGIQCSGIQEATPPTLAAYLTATIALDAADAATQANIVAAMGHPTAFTVAFRAGGIPNSAAVEVTSAARYVAIPIPPPPRPPHPPRPPYPPGMAPHSPPPPPYVKGGHKGPSASAAAPASAGAAIAAAMLAAVAALAL